MQTKNTKPRTLFRLWLCALALMLCHWSAQAQISVATTNVTSPRQISLAWDPSPDENVAGYFCMYGFSSDTCTNRLDVGNVTNVTLVGFETNVTYYFAVTAYSTDDLESLPSNQISYSPPDFYDQDALVFNPVSPQVFGSTNSLSVSGGSGAGAVSYSVLSGPGSIVDGSSLAMTSGSGNVVLVATKAGDADYYPISVTNTVSATKASQTITFAAIATQKATNVVTLSASASSGLDVAFNVISGPAILSGNQLSFSSNGTVVVVAQQAGDADYNAANPVTNTFTVNQIIWPSIGLPINSLQYAGVYNENAPSAQVLTLTNTGEIGAYYTNTVRYSSGASNWLSTSLGAGIIPAYSSITATSSVSLGTIIPGTYYATNTITSANATNMPVKWIAQLTISKASQAALNLVVSSPLTYGTTNLLSVTGGSGTGAVTYVVVSGPASIVGSNGLAITSGSGSVVVKASKAADSCYLAAENSQTVTTTIATQSALVFSPASPQAFGTTNILTASGGSGTGTVTYQIVSGPGVIIDGNKLVMSSGTGTVTVKAAKSGDANYGDVSATAIITAAKASQTIAFSKISTQKATNVVTLTATASSGLPVSYSLISGPAILSGTQLSFTGGGTVAVAAQQLGDADYSAATSITNSFNVQKLLVPPTNLRVGK